jgi:hypothetical protein
MDLPVLQRRRGRDACDLQYIPFVEGLGGSIANLSSGS